MPPPTQPELLPADGDIPSQNGTAWQRLWVELRPRRASGYLLGGLLLTIFLIIYIWWPLAEEYLALVDWNGPWWRYIDWLLINIFAVMSLLIIAGADLRYDARIVFVGLLGGLVIEAWGTQTSLWTYYTNERPPLWIIPAWPVASLAIDRLVRILDVIVPGARGNLSLRVSPQRRAPSHLTETRRCEEGVLCPTKQSPRQPGDFCEEGVLCPTKQSPRQPGDCSEEGVLCPTKQSPRQPGDFCEEGVLCPTKQSPRQPGDCSEEGVLCPTKQSPRQPGDCSAEQFGGLPLALTGRFLRRSAAAEATSLPAGYYRPLYWLTFGAFFALMLHFTAPTFDRSLTLASLLLVAFLILTPIDQRRSLLIFAAGAGLGYYLELWGTTRECWTYYTLQTPPLFAVLAHGMAALAFWRAQLVLESLADRLFKGLPAITQKTQG